MKYLKSFFHFSIGIALSLFLFEIFFVYSEISCPRSGYKAYQGLPEFFPDRKIFLIKEGFYLGRTNRDGILGDEIEKNKNEKILRIALIGDSYVEGFQVFPKSHFGYYLKSQLQYSFNGKKIEVLNFGFSGLDFFGMFQKYVNALKYQPDYIFFFINDRNFYNLKLSTLKSYLDGIPFNNAYYLAKAQEDVFIKDLGLYNFIANAYYFVKNNRNEVKRILFDKLSLALFLSSDAKYLGKLPNQINFEVISQISVRIKTTNMGKLFFVKIKNINPAIEAVFRKQGLGTISLDSAYQTLYSEGGNPFYWKTMNLNAHWNHQAHAVIGKFLANYIVNNYDQ